MDTTWAGIGPASITGFGGSNPDSGSGGLMSGVATAAATAETTNAPLYSPDNPMFWVGVLIAAAAGLVYASARVKVGPLKGAASV